MTEWLYLMIHMLNITNYEFLSVLPIFQVSEVYKVEIKTVLTELTWCTGTHKSWITIYFCYMSPRGAMKLHPENECAMGPKSRGRYRPGQLNLHYLKWQVVQIKLPRSVVIFIPRGEAPRDENWLPRVSKNHMPPNWRSRNSIAL